MVNFIIRIAYDEIDSATIDRINTELAKYGVAGALTGDDGKGYYLPPLQYACYGEDAITDVRDAVYRIAESIKPGATVIVTVVTNMAWAGMRQVEDSHPAMAAAKAAQ